MAKKDQKDAAASAKGNGGRAGGKRAPAAATVASSTPVEALTEPASAAAAAAPSTAVAVRPAPAPLGAVLPSSDELADALLVPLRIARRVLPDRRMPVLLGIGALGLVGVLDLPVAIGVGLGWEALRRWAPADAPTTRR